LDYLIEEVLEQQPERMQTFLLQTAILNQLAGPLCDALTGLDNGQQTLEYLEQANIFIVSLDNERRWYRYHHLFGDLLRQRLRQVQPDTIPTLHTRASRWFIGKGRYHEAIGHLLAAKDFSGAARLIKEIALDTVQRGEHTTVGAWINSFPEDSVKKQPYLCTLHAWALQLTGQLESAEARLNYAESALDNPEYQKDDDTDLILGLIHSHKSYLSFMRGEQEKVISYAHQALEQLPTSAVLIRAQTALYLGIAYRFRGQLHRALDVYNETLPTTQRMGGQSIAVLCYLHLGDLHAQMAHLHQAEELYTKGLQHTERHFGHSDVPFCGYAYVSIGRILRQRNQLDQAYHFTAKGVSLCQDWNVTDILALSYIELAYISEALGKDDQAQASMQKAIHLYSDVSPWASKYAAAHEASLDLLRGDIDAAARWAQGNDLVIGGDFEFHRAIEYTAMARVMLAQHQFAQAQRLVGQIHQLAVETGERQSELEALILLALLFNVQDNLEQGLVCLRNALSIAEPEGYIRVFVDEGPPMAALLYEALSRDIMPDYVRQLLAAFPTGEVEPTEPSEPQVSGDDWIEPLSERELEVLELVADGLTNREIAEKLFLSTQTVKVHTRNIYSKLDVHNRTEAVARGRALGILPVL
jgi:LuxR family maltose regulon positive regulatory protein